MLCNICRNGLEGMWDPSKTPRLGLVSDWFPVKARENPTSAESHSAQDSTLEKIPEFQKYVYAHHKTKESFQQSMDFGCVMCNRFGSLRDAGPYILNDNDEPVMEAEEAGYFSVFQAYMQKDDLIMCVRYGDNSGGFAFVPMEDLSNTPNLAVKLDPSTNGPGTWNTINKWFDTCLKTHTHCNKNSASEFFPTRLLAIDGLGSERTFRLVMGVDCLPGSRYCTLSHRWGNRADKKHQLLRTTMEQLQQTQPVSTLPKTFRDAIEVASRFGVGYIWIDCLCIAQDSKEDWRAEAGTMQQVYKNSFLSISALGAEDDNGGLFFDRNPAQITTVWFKRTETDEPKPFRMELERGWGWRLAFKPEPITTRGWVVQERLLPPRVLHFGRKQVFWECREQNACEIHPETVYCFADRYYSKESEQVRQLEEKNLKPHLWKQLLDAPDRRSVEDPYTQLFLDWNSILVKYTACELTVPSDKLVALSGLANDMKLALESLRPGPHRYLAGLWEEQLRADLCWFVNDKGKRPDKYRAPSWSWASIDGKTSASLAFESEEQLVWFVKEHECIARTTFSGEQDTGEVTDGRLTLTGLWARVRLGDIIGTGYYRYPTSRKLEYFILENEERLEVKPGELPTGQRFSFSTAMFDAIDEMPQDAFCMPIKASHWTREAYSLRALLLVPVAGIEEEIYRRIGLVTATFGTRAKAIDFFRNFPRKQIIVD